MLDLLDEDSFKKEVFDFSLNEEEWTNRSDKPICIFFYNDWCTYCAEVENVVKELSQKHKGEIIFYRINCDHTPNLVYRLKIISVPVVLFVPLHGEPQQLKGLFPASMIEFIINDILI